MGCDLAVAFTEHEFTAEDIVGSLSTAGTGATVVYLVMGGRRDSGSGERSFFALWSDERVDLMALCAALSARGRICVAWKSEHGGVAGYVTFDEGREVANESSSGGDYLLLPSQGVERAFSLSLGLADDARITFPEALLDGSVACVSVEPGTGTKVAQPPGTVDRLLEEDLDVEPVLPLDIW
jgi:hypothetical protein